MRYRKEKDSLGVLPVPAEALYGVFTQRAYENFRVSGVRIHHEFIKVLAMIKKACAKSNMQLDLLDKQIGRAIVTAANEVIKGKHKDSFPLDVYQAGAGTPYNMNVNEVLANRAIELRGGRRGDYRLVHPNNHVNMAQSTNNVIPTAIRITSLILLKELDKQVSSLRTEMLKKAKQYGKVLKLGRTHLEDAVPVMWGQVFKSYATSLEKSRVRLDNAQVNLQEVGIGGTAVGTGLNAHPKFQRMTVSKLSEISGLRLQAAKDNLEITWSADAFVELSSALRSYAIELNKMCNDLRMLNSGPHTGFAEIFLPEVEPGSSIMPGKVNPSILEAVNMICYQVIGYDTTIERAAEAGELELNVMTPLIAHNLFMSIKLLANGSHMLRYKAIKGLKVSKKKAKENVEHSLILVTALNPYIGYEVGAALVHKALTEEKTLRETIEEVNLIPKRYLKKLLNPKNMTHPQAVDKKVKDAIKKHKPFLQYKKKVMKKN